MESDVIRIECYVLERPLPAAPWFVHIFSYPGRVARVEIISAAEAAEIFGTGRGPFFAGQLHPAKSLRNAERLARRLRRAWGAHDKWAPRRWRNSWALAEHRRLTDIDPEMEEEE